MSQELSAALNKLGRSEIRHSQVKQLLEKVSREDYGKYLRALTPQRVRSFYSDDPINFDFPVTALIGPNGGGKSTILGAAACAYKSIKPGLFFPKSSIGDDSMADWSIEYRLIDKQENAKGTFKRSSKFRRLKWNRDNVVDREVRYFSINRTVPAAEKSSFKKLMKPSIQHEASITQIVETIAIEVQHILGKPVSGFKVATIEGGQTFYIGGLGDLEYSEFHFGAGEASIIRMVTDVELSENNSLILIEEIENGLHPVAVKRMVEYLISVAERKKVQAIFTTHSDAALEPLPPEAIWSAIDGKTQQGKLSVNSLRAISGRVDKRLAIFVEDDFAKEWVENIVRERLNDRFDEIAVYPLRGDGNAVKTHLGHRFNPSISFHSLCFIDGDSKQVEDNEMGIYRLPGEMPELTVFGDIVSNLATNIALLAVSCQRPPEEQKRVEEAIKSVLYTNRDSHLLFNQVGIQLGFVPEMIIKGAFLSVWIRENPLKVDAVVEPINRTLELPSKGN